MFTQFVWNKKKYVKKYTDLEKCRNRFLVFSLKKGHFHFLSLEGRRSQNKKLFSILLNPQATRVPVAQIAFHWCVNVSNYIYIYVYLSSASSEKVSLFLVRDCRSRWCWWWWCRWCLCDGINLLLMFRLCGTIAGIQDRIWCCCCCCRNYNRCCNDKEKKKNKKKNAFQKQNHNNNKTAENFWNETKIMENPFVQKIVKRTFIAFIRYFAIFHLHCFEWCGCVCEWECVYLIDCIRTMDAIPMCVPKWSIGGRGAVCSNSNWVATCIPQHKH